MNKLGMALLMLGLIEIVVVFYMDYMKVALGASEKLNESFIVPASVPGIVLIMVGMCRMAGKNNNE